MRSLRGHLVSLSRTLVVQGTGAGRPPLASPILSPSRLMVTPSVEQPVQVAVLTVMDLTSTLPGLALHLPSSRAQV